jgi:hypothetical protein
LIVATASDLLFSIVPSVSDLVGLAAVMLSGLAMLSMGRVLTDGRGTPELHLVAGWAGLCVVLTLWGVATTASLYIPAAVCGAGGIVASFARRRWRPSRDDWTGIVRILVLSLPIWAVMASVRPALPDTFTNFLPNAVYLFDHGMLPADGRAGSISVWPAFPYHLQFAAFLASLPLPQFPDAALVHFGVLLQVAFGLFLARVVAHGIDAAMSPDRPSPGWASCAAGLLLTTLLNPSFTPKVSFAGYAEAPIAVTLALAGWLAVRVLGALAQEPGPSSNRREGNWPREVWWLALILLALVGVKQVGIVLMAELLGLAWLLAVVDPRVSVRRATGAFAAAFAPSLILYGVWRVFVETHFREGELKLLPMSEWDVGILPETLRSIGEVILNKGFFFLCVAALFAWALASLRRSYRSGGLDATARLLAISSGMFPVYTAFLLFVYVAHMGGSIGAEAHSYFRYQTHLGLLMMLCAAVLLHRMVTVSPRQAAAGWIVRAAPALAVALILVSPLTFAQRLRFDLEQPQPIIRELAERVAHHVAPGERLALVLPGDNGSVSLMLRGVLDLEPPRRSGLAIFDATEAAGIDAPASAALEAARRAGYDRALVSCAKMDSGSGQTLAAALLRRNPESVGGWAVETTWPYPSSSARVRWAGAFAGEPLCHGSRALETALALPPGAGDAERTADR